MKKRNVGQRAIVLLDSIDLEILEEIKKSYGVKSYNGLGILELANALNIKHNNLKPHLDKLRYLNLIFAQKNYEGKVILGMGMENIKDLSQFEFNDLEDYEGALAEAERQRGFLKYLEKSRNYLYDNEIEKQIEFDLRKKKNIVPLGINLQKAPQNSSETTKPKENKRNKPMNTHKNKPSSSDNKQGEASK